MESKNNMLKPKKQAIVNLLYKSIIFTILFFSLFNSICYLIHLSLFFIPHFVLCVVCLAFFFNKTTRSIICFSCENRWLDFLLSFTSTIICLVLHASYSFLSWSSNYTIINSPIKIIPLVISLVPLIYFYFFIRKKGISIEMNKNILSTKINYFEINI